MYSLVENPPSYNYIFNSNVQLRTKSKTTHSCNLFFAIGKYFLQLVTNNFDKHKSRVKLQSKFYATCQHHNNSHYVPLLANLVENYFTNLVKGCCQLRLTCEWTSSIDSTWLSVNTLVAVSAMLELCWFEIWASNELVVAHP
jgi:hypothetical protein